VRKRKVDLAVIRRKDEHATEAQARNVVKDDRGKHDMRKPLMTLGALLAAGIMSLGWTGGSVAQDAAMASHPAHIHSGTCATLGDVVQPLSNVSAEAMNNGTPMAMMDMMMGSANAIPVESSVTTVQMALSDIVGGEHAINVHESAENIGNYIACGDIGGAMVGSNSLLFGIAPLNDSGYSGIASLVDNGDGTTTVYVYLTNASMMGGGMATPEA
jgi:hypothetical protein